MSLQPLLDAPWVVQVHAFSAMAAFFLGVFQLAAPKGALPHRTLGVVWLVLMAVVAGSSIFIRPALFPGLAFMQWFSWIHIFTVVTIFGIVGGVAHLARGGATLKRHSRPFIGIFIGGLVIAGGFAFFPGRIMHEVVFGG